MVGEAYGAGQDDDDAEQRRAPGEDVVEEVPLAYDMQAPPEEHHLKHIDAEGQPPEVGGQGKVEDAHALQHARHSRPVVLPRVVERDLERRIALVVCSFGVKMPANL